MRTMVGLAFLACSGVWANTYTVYLTDDAGVGSLRWAIHRANTHDGPDTILFSPKLATASLQPTTPLPALTDGATTIDGDTNGDGAPDVVLDGAALTETGSGLTVRADECTLAGLIVTRFSEYGIVLVGADGCSIHSCHIGVDRHGTTRQLNAVDGLVLRNSHHNLIGGSRPSARNVLQCGSVWREPIEATAVRLERSTHNTISGNYIGLSRDGSTSLDCGGFGIALLEGSDRNVVGGRFPQESNVIAGTEIGLAIVTADWNRVRGNLFGFAADGVEPLYSGVGLWLSEGAQHNTVGGRKPAQRNVFGGPRYLACTGIAVGGSLTADNQIEGNYVGLNAAGTAALDLWTGISLYRDGGNTVGGPVPEAANHLASLYAGGRSVSLMESSSTIQGNRFGLLPDGSAVCGPSNGVAVHDGRPLIVGNTFACLGCGLIVEGASPNPGIFRNTFRRCENAVRINYWEARCRLGNLSNAQTDDDGGNVFRPTCTWFVWNDSERTIRAEGNSFGTTSRAEINAKIHDGRDDPSVGRVDFAPLAGGVLPTEAAGGVMVSGATAVQTTIGAQIAFSLSAPATVTVTVLNVAGRPVATIVQDRAAQAGLQRVLWNGRSASGTRVPGGRYLVRVVAYAADGGQSSAMATVPIR